MRIGRFPESVQYYLLYILAFAIPVSFSFSAIAIGLLGAAWLFRARFRETLRLLKERKALWPWMLLYILHAISYFYSENKAESLFDLQTKFSLLVLPLIFGAGFKNIDKKSVERIFIAFICGVFFVTVWCLFNATVHWHQTGATSWFFYHDLVTDMDANAVYMAWYVVMAICLILFHQWVYYFRGIYRFAKVFLVVLLFVFFVLLSARMLTLLFIAVILPYYLYQVFSKQKYTFLKPVYIVVLLIALVVGLVAVPNPIRDRFENMMHHDTGIVWLDDYSQIEEANFNNVTLRLFIWRLGLEKINEENLWLTGGGNGDVHMMLNSKMSQYHFRNIHEDLYMRSPFYNIDAHNMYLQTLLMIGLPGLVLLVLIIFMPVFNLKYIKPYKSIYIVFICTSIFFFLQEAVFQTQAGVVFYSFFIMLFWIISYDNKILNAGKASEGTGRG